MERTNYKPKVKNETALKKYIKEDATKKSNIRDNGSCNCKCKRPGCNNIH